jgi:DNA-binding NtrC family response regulator
MPSVLVVDDDVSVAEFFSQLFSEAGYEAVSVHSGDDALSTLRQNPFDVVVSDVNMSGLTGLQLLPMLKAVPNPPDVILITGFASIRDAVSAVKQGAFDYMEKPVEPTSLLDLVKQALELRRHRGEHRDTLDLKEGREQHGIVGTSPATESLLAWIGRVALRNQPVLITGESGTGKELVARAIHRQGPRANLPFVAADCGALASGTIESELFGHVRGAFTGAVQSRAGLLESAGSGTLFLDELGELPLDTQVKLFRALQERQFRHLGADRVQKFEARIIAATSRNLERAMQAGRFRPELFYRLNVHSIELTPLRDRPVDIPPLAVHFLARHNEGQNLEISPEAMTALQSYDWPGNVRELENTIIAMVARSEGPVLGAAQLPATLQNALSQKIARGPLQEAERVALIQALQQAGGQVPEAAAKLGVSQATLYRKLAANGLRATDYRA